MIARRARYEFWRLLARVFGAAFRFARERQARCCSCFSCYFALNGRRLANEMMADAIREVHGLPKIDRRPS